MLRTLFVLAAAACVAAPAFAGPQSNGSRDPGMNAPIGPYGAMERPLPSSFYKELYRLTPREYHRLRAQGFSRDEVYMIANAASTTGLDTSVFANAIYQGMYARQIAYQFGLTPGELTHVRREWKTPEWAAATGEPAYTKDKLGVWW